MEQLSIYASARVKSVGGHPTTSLLPEFATSERFAQIRTREALIRSISHIVSVDWCWWLRRVKRGHGIGSPVTFSWNPLNSPIVEVIKEIR